MTLKVPGPLPYPPRTSPLGDCSDAARRRESADGIERGRRVLLEERFENTEGYGRETVARRGRAARQTALENVNPRAGRPAGTRAR